MYKCGTIVFVEREVLKLRGSGVGEDMKEDGEGKRQVEMM